MIEGNGRFWPENEADERAIAKANRLRYAYWEAQRASEDAEDRLNKAPRRTKERDQATVAWLIVSADEEIARLKSNLAHEEVEFIDYPATVAEKHECYVKRMAEAEREKAEWLEHYARMVCGE